jgi:hypothetical protein
LESVVSTISCFVFLCGGSYWKHQVSSPITTQSSKVGSLPTDWINSWQACSLWTFCSSVKQCRTNLVQIFHFPRSSIKILQTVSLLISSSSSIIRRVIHRLKPIQELFRSYHPLRSSSSRFSQPSWNLIYHSKTHVRVRALSP